MDKEVRKIEVNAICKIHRALALDLRSGIFEQIIKETVKEAIDYAHSCTAESEQLKENKKPTFKEWLESEGYVDCERHYLKNGIQYEVRDVLLNYEEKIRTL